MTDYVEYDEYGLKEVRCMKCLDTVVAQRSYIELPNKKYGEDPVNVLTMKKNSNWQQPSKVEVEIDGVSSFVEPIVCSACVNEDLETEDVMDQIVNGWGIELKHVKKWKDKDINDYKKKKKIKIKEK
jgi:hypothetical protein